MIISVCFRNPLKELKSRWRPEMSGAPGVCPEMGALQHLYHRQWLSAPSDLLMTLSWVVQLIQQKEETPSNGTEALNAQNCMLLIRPKLSDSTIKKVFFSTRISSSCCCFCVVWVSTWCELLTRCGVFCFFFFLLPRSIFEIVSFFSPQLLFLLVPVNMCSISAVSWIRSVTNKTQVQQNLHNLAAREVIRRSLLYLNAITPD